MKTKCNAISKFILFSLLSAAALLICNAEENDCGFGWYAGGAGEIVLPQGGASMRRLGGGAARVGRYFTDYLALECEAAWLEDKVSLATKAVWHLQGFELVNRFFGYERFDPFFTAGARGWLCHGQVGPCLGIGAFYYLTNNWALRFDADITIGVEGAVETVHSLSMGIQYSF